MIIKPLITEKSVGEAGNKKYTFKVEDKATKSQVKKAVEAIFGVKVTKVQTLRMHGKKYRTGKKWILSRKTDWKKAIVTVVGDKTIDLFDVGKAEK